MSSQLSEGSGAHLAQGQAGIGLEQALQAVQALEFPVWGRGIGQPIGIKHQPVSGGEVDLLLGKMLLDIIQNARGNPFTAQWLDSPPVQQQRAVVTGARVSQPLCCPLNDSIEHRDIS